MNNERLAGSMAVGAGVVVLFTHGSDYSVQEIAALSAGAGGLITYVVNLMNRFLEKED